jgi:hypothetical protein
MDQTGCHRAGVDHSTLRQQNDPIGQYLDIGQVVG